jgi:hypothetical protein
MSAHLWLRAETKPGEARSPLTPEGTRQLIQAGTSVTVERSSVRIFDDGEFENAGATLAPPGSWPQAPADAWIFGLKELPEPPSGSDGALSHRHIYFAHAFKEQEGWQDLLGRFVKGNGRLFDLEALTDENGRRIAAFGFWAGFAGAAVGLSTFLHHQELGAQKPHPALFPFASDQAWIENLRARMSGTKIPRALIIGALGRCGRGALKLFDALGIEAIKWDVAETAGGGPFEAILDVDLVVNAVFLTGPTPPFIAPEWVDRKRRLSVVADVSCDPSSPHNPLPIYQKITHLHEPARNVGKETPLWVVAVDHLPALLPRQSSEDYAAQLLPHLLRLGSGDPIWARALSVFEEKSASLRSKD